jgi:hypothetical protein
MAARSSVRDGSRGEYAIRSSRGYIQPPPQYSSEVASAIPYPQSCKNLRDFWLIFAHNAIFFMAVASTIKN